MGISFRSLKWKLFKLLPDVLRFKIVRNSIHIEPEALIEFKIKIAETKEELEQGFKLLYESYYEDGLMAENSVNLRITKYHILPTSNMIIALKGKEVIATVTHILDSPLGLPCDSNTDLKNLRKQSKRIAEISALAIKKEYRRNHSLLFAVTRYLYHYAVNYAGVDTWVICIRKRVQDYYGALFFFTPTNEKSFKYQFVNGVDAVVMNCNLSKLPELFKKHYDKQKPEKNLFKFYCVDDRSTLEKYPHSDFKTPTLPVLTPKLISYFFEQKLPILNELTDLEKREVLNSYFDVDYEKILSVTQNQNLDLRRNPRRVVTLDGTVFFIDENIKIKSAEASVLNVSLQGLLISCNQSLTNQQPIQIQIKLSNSFKVRLKLEVLYQISEFKYATKIIGPINPAWQLYIEKLESVILSVQKNSSEVVSDKDKN